MRDKSQYYKGHVIDMGEIAARVVMVKKPDQRALDDRPGRQENRRFGPEAQEGKKPQAPRREAR
jgi:hypothetical protein